MDLGSLVGLMSGFLKEQMRGFHDLMRQKPMSLFIFLGWSSISIEDTIWPPENSGSLFYVALLWLLSPLSIEDSFLSVVVFVPNSHRPGIS
jgi:hypothetical protein